jgi:hypothetical protein
LSVTHRPTQIAIDETNYLRIQLARAGYEMVNDPTYKETPKAIQEVIDGIRRLPELPCGISMALTDRLASNLRVGLKMLAENHSVLFGYCTGVSGELQKLSDFLSGKVTEYPH